MRMKALIALGRLAEAISVGLSALEDLKYPVPATDEAAEIFAVSHRKSNRNRPLTDNRRKRWRSL